MPVPFPKPAARRILLLALAAGIVVDVLVPGNATGLNAVLVMTGLLVAAALVAGRDGVARMDPVDAWVPVAALAFAAMPLIRADDWLVTGDLLLAATLGAGTVACLAGARITRGLVPAVVALSMALVVAAITGVVSVLSAVRPWRRADVGDTGAASGAGAPDGAVGPIEPTGPRVPAWLIRLVPVMRGLLLAVPVLALFGILFASADAVFAELARNALSFRVDVDLDDLLSRTAWVTVVAWGVAGLLALAAGFLPELIPGRGPSASPWTPRGPGDGPTTGWRLPSEAPPPPPWWTGGSLGAANAAAMRQPVRLGSIEAATVLALVAALFAGFVVLQLAYLFGGRDTMSVAGLTYAEYARRGFFELVAVALLAGMLVVALDLAVAWRGRAQLVASLVLLGLTAVVLLSAFLRLRLYQDMYGWTELRFVVLTGILWLAAALAATVWLLLARMSRWTLHVLGVLSLVTVAGMNLVGPQAFVAERNIERALNPALVPAGGRVGLDASYLAQLGDEAVPAVVAAYPGLPPQSRLDVDRFLAERSSALSGDPAYQGWASWNLTRERARDALQEWTPGTR